MTLPWLACLFVVAIVLVLIMVVRHVAPLQDPTTSDHGTILYECFIAFDDYCVKRGIKYYLVGGTAIGAMRNQPGGHMPWDDDMDVLVRIEDKQKFLDTDLRQGNFPFHVRNNWGFWSCKLKNTRACKSAKDFYLDIFFLASKPDGTYVIDALCYKHFESTRDSFDNGCMPCTFWGRQALCPVSVMDLDYPEWRQTIRRWSHAGEGGGPLDVSDPANAQYLKPFVNAHIANALEGREADQCQDTCWK